MKTDGYNYQDLITASDYIRYKITKKPPDSHKIGWVGGHITLKIAPSLLSILLGPLFGQLGVLGSICLVQASNFWH